MPRARTGETQVLRLYRGFLCLYPAEFRAEYGRELCLVFKDRWRAGRSPVERLLVWLQALCGILTEAPKEHYHMTLQDLRHAFRIMRQEPSVTAAAIAILALGIGSTTLVFSLANGLLIRPLPYPDPQRLVAVEEYSPTDPNESRDINFRNYLDMRSRTRLLADIGVYTSDESTIRGEGAAELVPACDLDDGAFRALGVAPLLGRFFNAEDVLPNGAKTVVLGEGLWRRRYGSDPGILGRVLEIDNSRRTVIGVMPLSFHFSDRAEMWLPLQMNPAKASRTDYFLHAVARLKPGVAMEQAGAEARAMLEQIHLENPGNNGWLSRVNPIRTYVAGSYREAVITLLAAVALLMLIACANVSSLLLVRASARVREMAVRTALGATRGRLVRQLVSESLLLGLAGGAMGVLLAYVGIPALVSLIPIDLPSWMYFSIDRRVLFFAMGVSLLTSLAFGIAPALGSLGDNLIHGLKEGGRGGSAGRRQKMLRHGLVAGEVAVSVILLAGAGLMIRSFLALRGQDLGFRPGNVLTMAMDYPGKRYPDGPQARALLERLRGEISSLPGVASVAFTTAPPVNSNWTRIFTIEGHPVELKDMPFVNHLVITPGYFQTVGIPLLEGRDFTEADFDAPHVVIVSRSFARQYWPGESPVGKRLRFGPPSHNEPWHTVEGVVADSRQGRLLKGVDRPSVYLPYSKDLTPNSILVRTAADPLQLAGAIRSRITGVERDTAVTRVLSLQQIVDRAAWQDRFLMVLFAAFAGLALALAAVGLYAALSFTVSLEAHEIGIRMALGASAASVRGMVMRQGMTLAGVGLAIGLGGALGLTRLLKTQLYQVSSTDPATYLTAPVVLLVVAGLAAFLPTRRATRVDPVIALRHE